MPATTMPMNSMMRGSSSESTRDSLASVSPSMASAIFARMKSSFPLSSPTATIWTRVAGISACTLNASDSAVPSTTRSAAAPICSAITALPTTGATMRSARSTGIAPATSVESVREKRESAARWDMRPVSGRRSNRESRALFPCAVDRYRRPRIIPPAIRMRNTHQPAVSASVRVIRMRVGRGSAFPRWANTPTILGTTTVRRNTTTADATTAIRIGYVKADRTRLRVRDCSSRWSARRESERGSMPPSSPARTMLA